MTHLGERITPLVDGQLPPDAAERAYAHVAGCTECRETLEAERLVKSRLAALPAPGPDAALTARLRSLAAAGGPVPMRNRVVPGSPQPPVSAAAAWGHSGSERPPGHPRGRNDRPAGRRRWLRRPRAGGTSRLRGRMLLAVAGALCLVTAGAVAVGVSGMGSTTPVVPPVEQFVVEHDATTVNLPYGNPAGTGR